jgi:DNA repair protein RecO (recombination protein O)
MRAERSVRVEAVILRHSEFGEADRLLTLFSREQGKIRAIAKGARKLLSRKAGHLEPFTRAALLLARGRDMWIVTQAETVEPFTALREDLLLTGYASYTVELLDRFSYEEGANPELYRLQVETLERLCAGVDPYMVVRFYEFRLLDLLGFRPQLFTCVSGGETIRAEDQFFSPSLGGVLCPHCGSGAADAHPVSLEALRYMRHYQRSSWSRVEKAAVPQAVRQEMEALLQHYLTHLLERRLNSPDFLSAIRRNP